MNEKEIMRQSGVKAFLLDLLYSNRCPFCGCAIPYDRLCCEGCFSEILWADENICPRCGKPKADKCLCSEREIFYDMCVCAAYYDNRAKQGIYNMKFYSETKGAVIFGRIIQERLRILGALDHISLAVPVPMSVRQRMSRGYNQSEIVARAAVGGTGIPVDTKLIFRRNVKKAQHFLNAEERWKAAEDQYYTSRNANVSLKGKCVLLIDDVLTTGATLNCCAGLLKNVLGAEKVICGICTTV